MTDTTNNFKGYSKEYVEMEVRTALDNFAEKIKEEVVMNKYISSGCQEEVFMSIDKIQKEIQEKGREMK